VINCFPSKHSLSIVQEDLLADNFFSIFVSMYSRAATSRAVTFYFLVGWDASNGVEVL
jgi:hypothetical protein